MTYYELRIMRTPDLRERDRLERRLGEFTVPLFSEHGIETVGLWTMAGMPGAPEDPVPAIVHLVSHESIEAATLAWPRVRAASAAVSREPIEVSLTFIPLEIIPALRRDTTEELNKVEGAEEGGARAYELRVYSPLPDMAEALEERFGYFTLDLFDRYGLGSVIYLRELDAADVPVPPGAAIEAAPVGVSGTEKRMVFVLAHPSVESAVKTWAAVAADPHGVPNDGKGLSQLEGKLIAYLRPTPTSPLG
jgi:hypothetical protein